MENQKIRTEKKSASIVNMEKQVFKIRELKKLWDQDVEDYNLEDLKAEKIYRAVKKSNLKSKTYLNERLFKNGVCYMFVNDEGELKTYKSGEFVEWKMIDKNLRKWFEEEVEPFKMICDINKTMVDIENRTINTFPLPRFNAKNIKVDKENLFVKTWLSYAKDTICGGDIELYDWTLDYVSFICQNKRTHMIPYLFGLEGTGKSLFIKSLVNLVGRKRARKATVKKFASEFTAFKQGSQLIYLEETVNQKSKGSAMMYYGEAITVIKDDCTEEYMVVRPMFCEGFDARNFSNIVMSSNYLLDAKDLKGRRFVIYNVVSLKKIGMDKKKWSKIQEAEEKLFTYLGNIIDANDEECFSQLFNYFYERKVTSTNLQFSMPKTSIKEDIQEDAECIAHKFIKHEIAHGSLEAKVEKHALHKRYTDYCKETFGGGAGYALFNSQIKEMDVKCTHTGSIYYWVFDIVSLKKNLDIGAIVPMLDIEEEEEEEQEFEELQDKPSQDEVVRRLQAKIAKLEDETLVKKEVEKVPVKKTKKNDIGSIFGVEVDETESDIAPAKKSVKKSGGSKKAISEEKRVNDKLQEFY